MKYKPLIFLSFSLLAAGCDNKSETPPTTMVETQKNISRKSANEYLTCDDTIVLKRINSQTLNKIQKNERLELIDIVSMQRSGIQPDTIIHLLNITQSPCSPSKTGRGIGKTPIPTHEQGCSR
jgi:hypothetical protein